MKKILLSAVIGLPMLFSQSAFAEHYHGQNRSHHYHGRPNNAVGPRTVYTTRYGVHRPVVVRRNVYYRPYYRPYYYQPIAHYHYGAFEPCYDHFHTTGIYWNVNVGSGGVGFGIQSGW